MKALFNHRSQKGRLVRNRRKDGKNHSVKFVGPKARR